MPISAPYNFVPLSKTVVFPDWADAVSHDIPFEYGISGTITCELTTTSPVYVRNGGNWEKSEKRSDIHDNPEAQSFFKVGNEYIIPGTSLKGMIRNVVEIASFGKMNKTDNKRYSLRDLTGGVSEIYADHMTIDHNNRKYEARAEAGWLEIDAKGTWWITACDHARIDHNDLLAHHGGSPDLKKKQTAGDKYEQWKKGGKPLSIDFNVAAMPRNGWNHSCGTLIYKKAAGLRAGNTGTIVFTGQPSSNDSEVAYTNDPGRLPLPKSRIEYKDRGLLIFKGVMQDSEQTILLRHSADAGYQVAIRNLYTASRTMKKRRTKHMEFIFFNNGQRIEVADSIKNDFLFIHAPGGKDNDEWEHWRQELRSGRKAPVFFLETGGRLRSFGLAQMYKLPYTNSVHCAIGHTSYDHLDEDTPDFADTIFGHVGKESSLKGRVSFSPAWAQDQLKVKQFDKAVETVLGAPKPTYYPNYIKQPNPAAGYKTFMDPKCEISGWKRYPARTESAVLKESDPSFPKPPFNQHGEKNLDVATWLIPLQKDTKFTFTIRVHNLLPVELGALVWALTWGGESKYVHVLGMGKSLGYGQVRIDKLVPHLVKASEPRSPYDFHKDTLIKAYADYMNARLKEKADKEKQAAAPTIQAKSDFAAKLETIKAAMSSENLWVSSDQMKQLFAMADPEYYDCAEQKKRLRQMTLGKGRKDNDFLNAKDARLALKLYADEAANR